MSAPILASRRGSATFTRWWLPCCWVLLGGPRTADAAPIIPGMLERVVLAPSQPYDVRVGIGQAKFLSFSCMGGPADVVISLSTYAERADPLLFLSLDPQKTPSFAQHDASSFGQWREDQAGDHYVVAKAVSPRGGILGLVNMRHFAGEELRGILSIRCTFIIAFDTLFWDHLKIASVCPVGSHIEGGQLTMASNFCSGHGTCGKSGACECDGSFAGPACEHSKTDVVVAADGHYSFKVETGRYQYFRIRIPPRFPGGYLEVKLMSNQPLVVLVRGNDIPTKSNFELSNFDDWINQRFISVLKYKVPPSDSLAQPVPYGVPSGGMPAGQSPRVGFPGATGMTPPAWGPAPGRHLAGALREHAGGVRSWGELFRRASDEHGSVQDTPAPRKLQGMPGPGECQNIVPALNSPACMTQAFMDCESSCNRCMTCVKGGVDGNSDMGCTDACNACVSPGCISNLAYCAANVSCDSSDANRCEVGCGSCMACFDSNDAKCSGCRCCLGCLPIAAKCSLGEHRGAEYNRFAFVGVYNHRRYYNDRYIVHAAADISLTADPEFLRESEGVDWIADLYDPFHDIRALEVTQRQVYPAGEQYIFDVNFTGISIMSIEVQLFRDRLTLLRFEGVLAQVDSVKMHFTAGPNITHILSSSMAAPKTFFDFDQMHEHSMGRVEVPTQGGPITWVALFGAKDGYLQMKVTTEEVAPEAPAIGFALVCVFMLLCALLVLGVIYGGAQKLGDFLGMDPDMPLMERLGCLIRQHTQHESTVALTRTGSLSGYIGSDVIDRSVEDQYLHRGGNGDDGI